MNYVKKFELLSILTFNIDFTILNFNFDIKLPFSDLKNSQKFK